MKNILNFKKIGLLPFLLSFMLIGLSSCDFDYDIADANSKADLTPPTADFAFKQGSGSPEAYKTYTFANSSLSATDYLWDFGNGNTVTTQDATFTFPGEGTYEVSLTASDKLNVKSTIKKTIIVVKPEIPLIVAPTIEGKDFEADSDKNFWAAPFRRVSTTSSVMQTTTSGGYYEGTRGGKFPTSDDRLGYQELTFTANTNYILTYKYRLKDGTPTATGLFTVGIVKPLTEWNLATLPANTIIKNTHVEAANTTSSLVTGIISFNSGANTKLAILMYNDIEEAYVDSFTLSVQ